VLTYLLVLLLSTVPIVGLLFIPVLLILWIWGMVDAYKTAVRLNTEAAAGIPASVPSTVGVITMMVCVIAVIIGGVVFGLALLAHLADRTSEIHTLF
jgi:hypothetical protein